MDRPLINASRGLLGCALAVFVYCRAAFPADTIASARVPIEAELIGNLDATRVKIGSAVYAKVLVRWQNKDVTLQAGTILKGSIVTVQPRTKTNRNSELALLFDCVEFNKSGTRPMALTLAAVRAPDDSSADPSEYQPLTEAVGLTLGSGSTGAGGPGVAGAGSGPRSLSAAATTVYLQPRPNRQPKTIQAGQVIGIRGVKISVSGGPEGSSVLHASGRDVRLASGSLLAFVAGATGTAVSTSAAAVPAANASAISSSVSAGASSMGADFADETDICSPPGCGEALSEDQSPANRSAATIPVKELGYAAPVKRTMLSFDYSSAIAYLSANELLFTFNPHILVRRDNKDAGFPDLHIIRAVLIDLKTKKVEHAVDWRVYDTNQYLWPSGLNRVLVHVGHELRMYGPHLKLLRVFPVNGRLMFVRMSPAQRYFAIGTLQERHSEAMHRQLQEAEGREPEEDVELQILDAQFRVLATLFESSRTAFPVLSDDGEFRSISEGHGRWRIEEDLWDGPRRVLTHVSSACQPQMMSVPPDFLFVVGCDRQANARWYRMLRRDGKFVMKGWSPSTELEHTALSSAEGDLFAVSVVKAREAIAHAAIFQSEDLESQKIDVYQVDDGKRVFAFRLVAPIPTKQTFALSPRGDQLAVLGADQISIYGIPGR